MENINKRPEGFTLYSHDKNPTALLVVYDLAGIVGKPEENDLQADLFLLK